jgi:glycosyltransferase involved in cell wall biosynthesis
MNDDIAVVIPAFNEEQTISDVVSNLRQYVGHIIVVDDCSSDATGKKAQEAGATVLRNEKNRGYDSSIDRGFKEALVQSSRIIVTFDADGQHHASDIPKMTEPIVSGRADVVAGMRPYKAHVAELVFALYTGIRFGVSDPLCGFKAYDRRVYEAAGPFDTLQSIGTELLLRAIKQGFNIAFVPIQLSERGDRSRFYNFRIRGNIKILKALFRVLRI